MYNKLRPIIPGKNETVIYKPCIKFWKWTPLLPAATLNVYVDASALRIKSTDKKYKYFKFFSFLSIPRSNNVVWTVQTVLNASHFSPAFSVFPVFPCVYDW